MLLQNNNEPPFIQGLKAARCLLGALKQKKLSENSSQNKTIARPILQAQKENMKVQEKQTKQVKEQMIDASMSLQQKLNQIGKELYQCNIENETYQAVFDSMSGYYQEKYKVIEQNQKLKRSGYDLKEKIEEFKEKIQINSQQITKFKIQEAALKQLTADQLKEYLILEAARSQQPILPRRSIFLPLQIKYQQEANQNKNEENLNLRWQSLSKQVVRKTTATRKQQVEQQDIRKSSYGSEMYSI